MTPNAEVRRLHPLSWLFITATSIKGLIVPAILVLFVSARNPVARYELLSLLLVGPALAAALLKQGIYNYRFTDEELVIREGILVKKERHIPYDRVHNIALVRNPFHRMLGVASARIETAAGGQAEAVMRVLTLEAVNELRRYTLGRERAVAFAAGAQASDAAGEQTSDAAGEQASDAAVPAPDATVPPSDATMPATDAAPPSVATAPVRDAGATAEPLLHVPTAELVKLGLISNRGFIVVAAFLGIVSQTNWWERDWMAFYRAAGERVPALEAWLAGPGSPLSVVLLAAGLVLLFIVLLRLFSVCWHVIKYHDFTLQRDEDDLRTEFGLLTRVSSLIPVRRIQLITISASPLHRCFGRAGIDLETAGAIGGGGSELGDDSTGSGLRTARQWLAPIIAAERAPVLIRTIMPEVDVDAVEWQPISPRAARRLLKKAVLAVAVAAAILAATLSLTPIPVSGWHTLWLAAVGVTIAWAWVTGWVRHAAFGLTGDTVLFRSGWLGRKASMVRFDKMQTVTQRASPFDRRHRMASVAVDTAGAGSLGHRIDIPYLDAEVADALFRRLYGEARATEFSW